MKEFRIYVPNKVDGVLYDQPCTACSTQHKCEQWQADNWTCHRKTTPPMHLNRTQTPTFIWGDKLNHSSLNPPPGVNTATSAAHEAGDESGYTDVTGDGISTADCSGHSVIDQTGLEEELRELAKESRSSSLLTGIDIQIESIEEIVQDAHPSTYKKNIQNVKLRLPIPNDDKPKCVLYGNEIQTSRTHISLPSERTVLAQLLRSDCCYNYRKEVFTSCAATVTVALIRDGTKMEQLRKRLSTSQPIPMKLEVRPSSSNRATSQRLKTIHQWINRQAYHKPSTHIFPRRLRQEEHNLPSNRAAPVNQSLE
ncbi:hypothetical protein B0H10DRAFT_1967622 [Mycena sp. CBHHK59/15]|nr:hypothetical protein B0H10DRAFT_1967622 [Mycena sp. CBHHK59/15]